MNFFAGWKETLNPRGPSDKVPRVGSRTLQLAAVRDHDLRRRGAVLRAVSLNLLHDVHSLGHAAEHAVLAVQPLRLHRAQEELRSVRVRAGVGHRQDAGSSVLELEVLVSELLAVDRLAACAVASREVTALAHEVGDHPVERASLVSESLLSSAQCAE